MTSPASSGCASCAHLRDDLAACKRTKGEVSEVAEERRFLLGLVRIFLVAITTDNPDPEDVRETARVLLRELNAINRATPSETTHPSGPVRPGGSA